MGANHRIGQNKKCAICSKEFYVPPCRKDIKCCSRKCGYLFRGQSNTGKTHFKKGFTPWNKGKKGLVLDKNYRKNLAMGRGWNKGLGMSSEDTRQRWTREYVAWRKAVFERDDWTCVWCFKRGGKLNADHIKSFALYPALRLELNNGRTLCTTCHKKTDNYGRLTKKQKEEANLLQVGAESW